MRLGLALVATSLATTNHQNIKPKTPNCNINKTEEALKNEKINLPSVGEINSKGNNNRNNKADYDKRLLSSSANLNCEQTLAKKLDVDISAQLDLQVFRRNSGNDNKVNPLAAHFCECGVAMLKLAPKFHTPRSPVLILTVLISLLVLLQLDDSRNALAFESTKLHFQETIANEPEFEISDKVQQTTQQSSFKQQQQIKLINPESNEDAGAAAAAINARDVLEGLVIERCTSQKVLVALNLGSRGDFDVAANELDATQAAATQEHKIGKREPKLQQPIVFTNQFVIRVEGGESEARKVAAKHGFVYLNHILDDYYHLEHARLSRRSISDVHEHGIDSSSSSLSSSIQDQSSNATLGNIEDEPKVLMIERQMLRRRVKRDFLELDLSKMPVRDVAAAAARTIVMSSSNQAATSSQPASPDVSAPSGEAGRARGRRQRSFALLNKPANQQPGSASTAAAAVTSQREQQAPRITSNLARQNQHQNYIWQAANQPAASTSAAQLHQMQRARQQQQANSNSNGQNRSNWSGGDQSDATMLVAGASNMSYLRHKPQPQSNNNNNNNNNHHQNRYQQQPQHQHHNHDSLLTSETSPNVMQSTSDASQQTSASSSNNNSSLNLHAANSTATLRSGQSAPPFNDPSWPLMWYLDGGAKNGFDLNVMAAWKLGYTGKGIVITILDDGLEKDHPDLQANYDPLASFDINGDDADPMPRYDANDSNRHGTRCAGEVAAVPDNNICSIGIAYNSKVGGVRMLDGEVTDAVEARSLGLNNQHIHIYSASWGPDDNGRTVDGPGELATKAFIDGVTNGRQGLGSIFVFASGNGGRERDNCNCDGYTNSIWTLSISSASENGGVPWYIESCSSTLATTYSSGNFEERQIATTDLHHSCTSSHTGTSASAPLAAGICALVLESNPRLTWRDMQHIVVRTAKPANLDAKDWKVNALGRNVSHAFGYGLMDAAAMINLARQWTTVPEQYNCQITLPSMDKFIPPKGSIELKLNAKCPTIRFLEHVQSKVSLTASRRGDLQIYLVSPLGTRSTLLATRPNDQAEQGFKQWPFMTVHSWGESPNGIWTLEVHNDGKPQNRAFLKEWTLILYGTQEDPNWHLDSRYASLATPGAANNHIIPPPLNHNNNNNIQSQSQNHKQHHNQSHVVTNNHQAPVASSSLPPPPIQTSSIYKQQPQQNQADLPKQANWPSRPISGANKQVTYQQHVPPPTTSTLSPHNPAVTTMKTPMMHQTTTAPKLIPTTTVATTTQTTPTTSTATMITATGQSGPARPVNQDFDVVLPASNPATQTTTPTINLNEQNLISTTTRRPAGGDNNGWTRTATTTSDTINAPTPLDNNNNEYNPAMKPPVSLANDNEQQASKQGYKIPTTTQLPENQPTNEIDTNQIDLSKQAQIGKDYRSTNNNNRTSVLEDNQANSDQSSTVEPNPGDDATMTTPYEWFEAPNKRQQFASSSNLRNQSHLKQQHHHHSDVKASSSGAAASTPNINTLQIDHLLIISSSILMTMIFMKIDC